MNNLIQLSDHFSNDERDRHSEQLRRKQWFIKAKIDHAKREEVLDNAEEAMITAATVITAAANAQIAEFERTLDIYDEATVKALMLNQEQLDTINIELMALLDRAHVIEDGRRVFKTQDGTQVFDEHGVEIGRDEVDFDAISPNNPSWEKYQPIFTQKSELEAERKKIHEFQDKVDDARKRIDEGGISEQELDDLDAELADVMPPSVKVQISGFDTVENAPDLTRNFAVSGGTPLPINTAITSNMPAPPDLNL